MDQDLSKDLQVALRNKYPEFCEIYSIKTFTKADVNDAINWYLKFDEDQINQIRRALRDKTDVTILINEDFDDKQMKIIRYALRYDVNVDMFTNPRTPTSKLLYDLSNEVISKYKIYKLNLGDAQLEEISRCIINGFDFRLVTNPKYSPKRISLIRQSLQDKLYTQYSKVITNLGFSDDRVEIILECLVRGFDIDLFLDTRYSISKLRILLEVYKNRLDIKEFSNPLMIEADMLKIYNRLLKNKNLD